MNHFSDIGFKVEEEEDFAHLVLTVAKEGKLLEAHHGNYFFWSPASGIELWAQTSKEGRILGLNPHFSGVAQMRARVTDLVRNEEFPLDGSLSAWADPDTQDDPQDGLYPFLVDLPDFDLVKERINPPEIVTLQVAAFAHDMNLFPNEQTYLSDTSESSVRYAAESFIPSGLFVKAEENEQPRAEALITGIIEEVNKRVNPTSGLSFYHIVVKTFGAKIDVVVDPSCLSTEPVIDGIAQGNYWLSARVISGKP